MNSILKFWPVLIVGVSLIVGYVRLEVSANDAVRRIEKVEPTVSELKTKMDKGEIAYTYITDKMEAMDTKIDKMYDILIKVPPR